MKMNTDGFELFIDIDNDFDRFLQSRTFGYIRENWKYVRSLLRDKEIFIQKLEYRRSSSGHVHLRLTLSMMPNIIDQFQIRSLLHDDPWRIGIDLRRLAIQGSEEINRIFDRKIKNGITHVVGPWLDISAWVGDRK